MSAAKLLCVGIGLSVVGSCAEGEGTSEPENVQHHALIANDGDRTIFVLGPRQPAERLPAILAEERTEYWYTRIEVPHLDSDGAELDLGAGLRFQLDDPSVAVRYAHTFKKQCNPYDATAEPIFCWVVLRLESGEPGLKGEIAIRRPDDGSLRIDTAIEYEGTYSKFDGQIEQPSPATYGYTTEMREGLASEYVEEIEL